LGFQSSNVDYIGISKDAPATHYFQEYPLSFNDGPGGAYTYEFRSMDALDLPKELAGKKIDFTFGLGFLGFPMEMGAKQQGVSENEFTKRIIESISEVTRDGGISFYLNREPSTIRTEDFIELGFEAVEIDYMNRQGFIIRKTKDEIEEQKTFGSKTEEPQ